MSLPHASKRRARLAAALVVSAFLLGACGGADSNGTSIADVPFTAADGATASLSTFRGTPVVVNLWATWCAPCVKEMPAFDEVAAEQAGTPGGVRIIGLNVGDTAQAATEFAADLGVSYPQYTDPDGELSTALHVTGYPATAFVDADGKLLDVHQGAFTADELRAAIARIFPDAATEGTQS